MLFKKKNKYFTFLTKTFSFIFYKNKNKPCYTILSENDFDNESIPDESPINKLY
jgi:hypothetical protein